MPLKYCILRSEMKSECVNLTYITHSCGIIEISKIYCSCMNYRKAISMNGDCATPVEIFKGKGKAFIGNGIEKMD